MSPKGKSATSDCLEKYFGKFGLILFVLAGVACASCGTNERKVDRKEFEITPEAKSAIDRMAKDANAGSAWWLRIRYVPDDFWGLVPNMEITKQPPEPAEGSFRSDGIAIKYLREDYPLIQGGQINWVAWAGHESLELSSPNRTPENKKVAEERETEGQIRALTEQLLANPKAAVKFFYRARGWKKKREYAKALSDYNAAIRLQPGEIVQQPVCKSGNFVKAG